MGRSTKGTRLIANKFGIFEICWSEGGRSKRCSTGAANRQEAEKVLGGFLLERDVVKEAAVPTVAFILEDYWIERGNKLPSRDYVQKCQRFFGDHMGELSVAAVDAKQMEAYSNKRRAGLIGICASDGTLRREISVLVAAINHALRNRRIKPGDVPFISMPAAPPGKDRWLTQAEFNRLRDCCASNARLRLFVELAIATASRRRALETLMWFQVDLDRGIIQLNPVGRPQTKKRHPTVPISDHLLPLLQDARAKATTVFVLGHDGTIRTAFNNAVKRAGLKSVTPHTLRHTWATWAAQAGTSLWEIAGVLGDTMATAEKTYAHHAPDYLRNAVNFRSNSNG